MIAKLILDLLMFLKLLRCTIPKHLCFGTTVELSHAIKKEKIIIYIYILNYKYTFF